MKLTKSHQKIDEMNLQALLAEYQQLYEHSRHDNNIGLAIQGILAVSSFAIVAFAFKNDSFDCVNLIVAAITSILFYFCYLLYFEQLRMIIYTRIARIAEIEEFLSDNIDNVKMDFIKNIDRRIEEQMSKDLNDKRQKLSFISNSIILLSKNLSQRFFRIGFLFLLMVLWTVRILPCAA